MKNAKRPRSFVKTEINDKWKGSVRRHRGRSVGEEELAKAEVMNLIESSRKLITNV